MAGKIFDYSRRRPVAEGNSYPWTSAVRHDEGCMVIVYEKFRLKCYLFYMWFVSFMVIK